MARARRLAVAAVLSLAAALPAALTAAPKPPPGPPPADLPPPPDGRFVDNGDGTVTDTWRRIMWQKADSGKELSWEEAWDYGQGLSLAGHDDWRLPSQEELGHKLYDALHPPGKWIPDRRVPQFQWSGITYWTRSSGDVGHRQPGMCTRDFAEGWSGVSGRGAKHLVRACRDLPRPDGPRFKDNGDGTVTDRWEGLTWTKADSGRPLTLADGHRYCEALTAGGGKGWRVPTLAELRDTLYMGLEETRPGLGADRRVAPFDWSGEEYWTNDPIVPEGWPKGHYAVRFRGGASEWVHTADLRFVRACRDGR